MAMTRCKGSLHDVWYFISDSIYLCHLSSFEILCYEQIIKNVLFKNNSLYNIMTCYIIMWTWNVTYVIYHVDMETWHITIHVTWSVDMDMVSKYMVRSHLPDPAATNVHVLEKPPSCIFFREESNAVIFIAWNWFYFRQFVVNFDLNNVLHY